MLCLVPPPLLLLHVVVIASVATIIISVGSILGYIYYLFFSTDFGCVPASWVLKVLTRHRQT